MTAIDSERSWQQLLARQVDDLGRWVQGRVVLAPDQADELVPAARFFDMQYLRGGDRPGPFDTGTHRDHAGRFPAVDYERRRHRP